MDRCQVCKVEQVEDYNWCLPLCSHCEPLNRGWQVCENCYEVGKLPKDKEKEVYDGLLRVTLKSTWDCPQHRQNNV